LGRVKIGSPPRTVFKKLFITFTGYKFFERANNRSIIDLNAEKVK
jgi:hypothetical protein